MTIQDHGSTGQESLTKAGIYKTITELFAKAVWETDATGQIVTDSPSWRSYTGQSVDQWLHQGWLGVVHPDDQQLIAQSWRQALESQTQFEAETRIRQSNGDWKWTVLRVVPIHGQTEIASLWIGMAIVTDDIPVLKRQEANRAFLSEINDELLGLSTASEVMQWIGVRIGNYLQLAHCSFIDVDQTLDTLTVAYSWSRADIPALAQTYGMKDCASGWSRECRDGKVVVVNDTRTDARTHATLYTGLQILSFAAIPFNRRGEWKLLIVVADAKPRHWRQDEIELLQEVCNRVFLRLERAGAEESLKASQERFELLVSASFDSIYMMSADWRQMLNLKGMNFLTDTDQVSSNWVDRYIPLEDRSRVQSTIEEAIQNKQMFELEHQVLRVDGTIGWTLSRAIPVLDSNGQIRHWFGAASDITARRQPKEELRLANQRKDEFLAILAHELRNPLAPIRSGLQLLSLTAGDDQTINAVLPIMNRQMDHLVHMLDDLLDVSRISQGKIELRKERINFTRIVSQAIETMHSQYKFSNRILTVELPPVDLYMDGDATRLQQVVVNLLTNGIRYTRQNGQVTLSLQQDGQQAMLRVRDNGIGLAASQLKTIFELFVQVNHELARSNDGLGVGLALVKQLVNLHGGWVEASSPGIDQGSEFIVCLPLITA